MPTSARVFSLCAISYAAAFAPAVQAQFLDSGCHQISMPADFGPAAFDDGGTVVVGTKSDGNVYSLDLASATLHQLTNDAVLDSAHSIFGDVVLSLSSDGRYVLVYPESNAAVDPATNTQVLYGGGPAFVLDTTTGERTTFTATTAATSDVLVLGGALSASGNYVFVYEEANDGIFYSRFDRSTHNRIDLYAKIAGAVGSGFTVADFFNNSAVATSLGDSLTNVSGDGDEVLFSAGYDLLGSTPRTPIRSLAYNKLQANSLGYFYKLSTNQLGYAARVDLAAPPASRGISSYFILHSNSTGMNGRMITFARSLPILGTASDPSGSVGFAAYVSDTQTQTSTLITPHALGPHGDPFAISFPFMTRDEKAVIFSSDQDFAGSNPSGTYQLFRYDIAAQSITQVTNFYDPLASLLASLGLNNPSFTEDDSGYYGHELQIEWSDPDGSLLLVFQYAFGGTAVSSSNGISVVSQGSAEASAFDANDNFVFQSVPTSELLQLWDCRP